MAERMVEAGGVELCTEAFGDSQDPPLLLIMGIGASMLWWEEGLCRMLSDRGRFVIRYDHRDTGRSTARDPGHPDYTGSDLTADAVGVLDAYGIASAHLVGVSAGGGIAQEIALRRPDRVRSLVLVSTTAVTDTGRELPPPTPAFMEFVETAEVDWSSADSVVDYLVAYQRVLAGARRAFDEEAIRELVRQDVERARSFASLQNHDLIAGSGEPVEKPVTEIAAPTLVIHGTADPMFPLGHGEALAAEIAGARLLAIEDAGHGVFRPDWETIADAVAEHTGA